MKTKSDDGLEWLRDIRRDMAAEFAHDPKKIGEHIRKLQREHPERLYRRAVENSAPALHDKPKPYRA